MKELYKALSQVQEELKAPKGQRNSFGNYNYRSAEDILEAVKPLLKKNNLMMTISDELINLGDRFYVKATVTVFSTESDDSISVDGVARESLDKKGMDASQITGATSSYARKYALNGMFNIDDTKDADTDEYQRRTQEKQTRNRQEESKQGPEPMGAEYLLKKAKEDINKELEAQGYIRADQKKTFVKKVLEKETIDTMNDAELVADALDNER